MTTSVTIKIQGDVATIDGLTRVQRYISEPGELQNLIKEEIMRGIQRIFRLKTSPDGIPWKRQRDGFPSSLRETNALFNSIRARVQGPDVIVEATDIKANIHNEGGEIKASPGKYLAIPLDKSTAPKFAGGWRRDFPDAFVIKLGGAAYGYDRLWLVQKMLSKSKGGGKAVFKFLALLVKSVNMPQREFMGISDFTERQILDRAAKIIEEKWGNPLNIVYEGE
jgi:phage gpG-like protein